MTAEKSILNPDGTYINLIKENPVFDAPPQGEQFTRCEVCGERFEQLLITEKNRYTQFKKCAKHRHTKKGENTATDAEVMRVVLDYTPHPAQQLFHNSAARFRVLNCLLPGEILNGKKIEHILPGDDVLSRDGVKTKVLRSIQRGYDGEAITVNAIGVLPYQVTENHPILVAEIQKNDNYAAFKAGRRDKKTKWKLISEEWHKAADLAGMKSNQQGCNQTKYCLKIPRIKGNRVVKEWNLRPTACKKWNDKRRFPINKDTAWFLGLYCAEGNTDGRTTYITLNEDENEYREKFRCIFSYLGYSVGERHVAEHHCVRLWICSVQLAERMLEEFGESAREKRIPDDILYNADDDILLSFLAGYYAGDGHYQRSSVKLSAKTASKTLALQLQLAWARFGVPIHIAEGYRTQSSICGRQISNKNPFYQVRTSDYRAPQMLGYQAQKKEHREFVFTTENAIYVPIKEVKKSRYKGTVYDIHTESETFILNNTVNHNCGSRFGKDRATTMEAIQYFLACLNEERGTDMIPSVYWWIIAPTERMAKQNWNELKRYFPKDLVVDVSNSGMMLQTVYGGLIEVRSAYDPESLVGVGLDLVTITEAARIADLDIVWANLEQRLNSPGRGLGGEGGIGIINSSPKGRNYFYKMWTWGQAEHPEYDPDWESWTFTTWDNPEMAVKGEEVKVVRGRPLDYKTRLKRRLGEARYNQDILAMFLAGQILCFPTFMENCVERLPDDTEQKRKDFAAAWRRPEPLASYVLAYDPASVNDIPAAMVIDNATGRMKNAYNMTGLGWNAQYDKLAQISKLYNNAPVAFSQTGHMTIQEELEKRGLVCLVFNEQGANKENYVNRLEGVCESGDFRVLDDGSEVNTTVIAQFCDYSRVQVGKSVVYKNVDEPHDDFCACAYIAFQAITTPDEALPFLGNVAAVNM